MKFCLDCSSFRVGLYLVLKKLKLQHSDVVLMSPITIPDTLNIIALLHLKAEFIDLDPRTHTFCLKSIEQKTSKKTKVLLLTHLSGVAQDMSGIYKFAQENNLFVIEDTSQAHGTKFNKQQIGQHADVVLCSLSTGKQISTFFGGMILSNHTELMLMIQEDLYQNHTKGIPKRALVKRVMETIKVNVLASPWFFSFFTYHLMKVLSALGLIKLESLHHPSNMFASNQRDPFFEDAQIKRSTVPHNLFFRIKTWQAWIGYCMTKNVDIQNYKRVTNAQKFIALFNGSEISRVSLPHDQTHLHHNFYHLPLYFRSKDDLQDFQKRCFRKGLDLAGYGLPLCSSSQMYPEWNQDLEGARKLYDQTLFVFIDDTMKDRDVQNIARICNEVIHEMA